MPKLAAPLASFAVLLIGSTLGCCPHRFERPAGPAPDPEMLLERAGKEAAGLRSYEIMARARLFSEGRVLKSDVEVLARRPGALRFEVVTPTGDTLAVLRTDGRRFTSHQRGDAVCAGGEACAANVARVLPIALPPAALFDALSGRLATLNGAQRAVEWDECEGAWRLEQRDAVERHLAWLAPGEVQPYRMALERDGVSVLVMEVSGREAVGDVALPSALRVELPDREEQLELDFVEVYVNGELGDELFDPVCPHGTRFQELECPR